MPAVRTLCSRALMLSNGRVEDHGEVPQVIATDSSKSRIDGDSLWLRPDTLPIELAGFKRVAITVDGSASHMILRCNLQLDNARRMPTYLFGSRHIGTIWCCDHAGIT